MLTETLKSGLGAYQVGPKIRRMRQDRGMGLVELGRHSGLSPALLSKIETAKAVPTLPTLLRIAMVFSVGLDHFFRPAEDAPICAIVRRRDRLRFPEPPSAEKPAFWFESLDFAAVDRKLSAYLAEFEPQEKAGALAHKHEGAELIYVIDGALGLWVNGCEHRLDKGDSVYFDSSAPHAYRRLGDRRCSALVVTTA